MVATTAMKYIPKKSNTILCTLILLKKINHNIIILSNGQKIIYLTDSMKTVEFQ